MACREPFSTSPCFTCSAPWQLPQQMLRTAKGFAVLSPLQESSDPFSSSTPIPLGNFLLLLQRRCALLPPPFPIIPLLSHPSRELIEGKNWELELFQVIFSRAFGTPGDWFIHFSPACNFLLILPSSLSKGTEQHVAACHQKETHTIPNPIITMTFDALACETNVCLRQHLSSQEYYKT